MTPSYELLEALESALDAHSIDADLDAEFEDDPDLVLVIDVDKFHEDFWEEFDGNY